MSGSQLLTENWFDEQSVADVSFTSETVGFPGENSFRYKRRSKIWRTTGHFFVAPGDNVIEFEETAFTPLTATVTPGSYATFALFAAALKAALEVEGASTYTVTQVAGTKKIRIASNGSGGGGIFTLRWTDLVSEGMAQLMGFAVTADDTGSLTYTADDLVTSTSEWIYIDFGMAVNPDAVVATWRSDELSPFTPEAKMLVRANFTNDVDSSPYTAEVNHSDYGFALSKAKGTEGVAPIPYRFWRLEFIDKKNPESFIDLGSIFIGKGAGLGRGAIQFPFSMGRSTGAVTQVTESGVVLARESFVLREFNAEWFGLTQAEKENFDAFFDEVSTARPFYILLDPATVVSDDPLKSLVYVRFDSVPSWSMDFPGVYSCGMSLREEI